VVPTRGPRHNEWGGELGICLTHDDFLRFFQLIYKLIYKGLP
jgi:hypothetical protein